MAKAKDNLLDQMDFFKNSFWGTPIPMSKINRILLLKQSAKETKTPSAQTAQPEHKRTVTLKVGNLIRRDVSPCLTVAANTIPASPISRRGKLETSFVTGAQNLPDSPK